MRSTPPPATRASGRHLFEFAKGVFVILMGYCAIALVQKDVWVIAESLFALFHIGKTAESAQVFLDFADNVTERACGPRRALHLPTPHSGSPKFTACEPTNLGRVDRFCFWDLASAARGARTVSRGDLAAMLSARRKRGRGGFHLYVIGEPSREAGCGCPLKGLKTLPEAEWSPMALAIRYS